MERERERERDSIISYLYPRDPITLSVDDWGV